MADVEWARESNGGRQVNPGTVSEPQKTKADIKYASKGEDGHQVDSQRR